MDVVTSCFDFCRRVSDCELNEAAPNRSNGRRILLLTDMFSAFQVMLSLLLSGDEWNRHCVTLVELCLFGNQHCGCLSYGLN